VRSCFVGPSKPPGTPRRDQSGGGPGATGGEQLAAAAWVAKVSFAGSADIGRRIAEKDSVKKVPLELGKTSPVIIAADADLKQAALRCAVGAYYNSGQVCISVQRICWEGRAFEPFTEHFMSGGLVHAGRQSAG
jgi:acyl-CoA reductase-like NAD-dependent aldehyde dehydrogenase